MVLAPRTALTRLTALRTHLAPTFAPTRTSTTSLFKMTSPHRLSDSRITSSSDMETSASKWVGLQSIQWVDPTGKSRTWETAYRKTLKPRTEADAVAICCLVSRPSTREDPDVLLVSQFRPPVALEDQTNNRGKTSGLVLEMPAGLIDEGEEGNEGTLRAAMRELREETGYGQEGKEGEQGEEIKVLDLSPLMHNDPGMVTSTMKLACLSIHLASDDAPDPVAQPDEGEFIEKRLVKLSGLWDELKRLQTEEKYAVDARLSHFAWGVKLAGMVGQGKVGV